MIHINLNGRLKHDVKDSNLSEYPEAGVALKKPKAIWTYCNARDNHADNGRDSESFEKLRAQKDYQQYNQKYGYWIMYQGSIDFIR